MGNKLCRRDDVVPPVDFWMASLRAAMFDAITEADVTEIVRGLVARAKQGDDKAIKVLFAYLCGGPATTSISIGVRGQAAGDAIPPSGMIDVGPGPDDPTPAEIARATAALRSAELEDMRDRPARSPRRRLA